MKIKKLPNTKKVIVEFEEFLTSDDFPMLNQQAIESLSTVARRTAYNMWEFKTLEEAHRHLFMLELKL